MKKFSLEEYLKNPSRKVMTKNGLPVRIICTDRIAVDSPDYPIIVLMKEDNYEELETYTKAGKSRYCTPDYDLYFEPQKHEGWMNLYLRDGKYPAGDYIFDTREAALDATLPTTIATVKVEWED